MPTPPVPPRVRGPIDRRGARSAGISDWQLRHDQVLRTSRDTYLPRAAAADLRQRIEAVLLAAPNSAVVSHLTAASLWGLAVPLVGEGGRIDLTVPPGDRVRSRADRRIHCSVVPQPETREIRGLRVTSSSRTWLDLAARLPPASLLAVSDQMLARGFPPDEFSRVLDRYPGQRGVASARRVATCADALAGSPMESVLRWLIHEAGLPAPVLQYVVRSARGHFLGQADLAWPDHRVIVEFDGEVHRERKVFVEDLRRQNGIVLAGWRVLRFTSADVLGRPRPTVDAIGCALGGR